MSRNVRYGFKKDGNGKLVPVMKEVRVIRRILLLADAGLMSPAMIADELNEDGVPTPRGGRWSRSTIDKIIADNVAEFTGLEYAEPAEPDADPPIKHGADFLKLMEAGEYYTNPEGEVFYRHWRRLTDKDKWRD